MKPYESVYLKQNKENKIPAFRKTTKDLNRVKDQIRNNPEKYTPDYIRSFAKDYAKKLWNDRTPEEIVEDDMVRRTLQSYVDNIYDILIDT